MTSLRHRLPFFFAAAILTVVPTLTFGSSASDTAVHQLAQQCFAVQSPGTGKYLKKVPGLLTDNEIRYKFRSVSRSNATAFFIKPAALGQFLLTDPDGEFLGSRLATVEVALRKPGRAAEWQVAAQGESSSGFRYVFTNRFTGAVIRHHYTETVSWWWFSYKVPRSEKAFKLVPRSNCRDFPEVQVNVKKDGRSLDRATPAGDYPALVDGLKVADGEPVRGVVDAHSHITSNEFMGGKVIHGDPFHRWGVEHALIDCDKHHGPDGKLDLIGGSAHNTSGWPDFTDWPDYNMKTHSGYYYKWLERAWLGGLRMTVVYLVENQVLCNVQTTVNPVSWTGGNNSCNTMDSLFLQIERMQQMQNYIDAQFGGPGKGFLRIVKSPEAARDAIADGKLAVVLGVEASEVLNCGERDYCDRNVVDNQLNALYDAGVRVLYPVHKFDNHFAGTSLQGGMTHLGQKLSTGHYFETEACDENIDRYSGDYVRGRKMKSGVPGADALPVDIVQDLLGAAGPQYDEDVEQCNRHGLTNLGAYLVNRLIDKRMIIDLDHLSPSAAASVLDIAEARGYAGMVSTHGWMRKGKNGPDDHDAGDDPLHENLKRLLAAGGFVAPLNEEASVMIPTVEQYLLAQMENYPRNTGQLGLSDLELLERLPAEQIPGVGIGVDMGGLAGMARPEGELEYPFESASGFTFDRQRSGNRTFDITGDGVAHYGMLADHLAQVRKDAANQGKSYVYESLMNSAQSYLDMWREARGTSTGTHVYP